MSFVTRLDRLPTAAKLMLLLSAALLPIGAALVSTTTAGMHEAKAALRRTAAQEARAASGEIDSLIARNALALRIAANAALDGEPGEPCLEAQRTLAIAPGVTQRFELEDGDGKRLCSVGAFPEPYRPPMVAPGDIKLWIAEDGGSLLLRTGVARGSATTMLTAAELRTAIGTTRGMIDSAILDDGRRSLTVTARTSAAARANADHLYREPLPIANGRLLLNVERRIASVSLIEQLSIWLPVLMWALAALVSWLLFHRLLLRPLRRLQRSVSAFSPGDDPQALLTNDRGAASEIGELGQAFARAVERVDEGERQMAVALEGQRRLVREVHHRVKNNLQVVASLLSIHGRSANGPEGRAAYAAIGRRVDALAVVHRNHFAELEENQGIQLGPMLNELTSGLRASAPDESRAARIELELDHCSTTQDAAVATAFLITEVVEYAMLSDTVSPVEILLRRTSPLTARLTMASQSLLDEGGDEQNGRRQQFERIVAGLARQLRSPLEKKLGRYSVDLPVFPER